MPDKQEYELYKNYKNKKIIYGIKNSDLKITFKNAAFWKADVSIFLLLILLGLIGKIININVTKIINRDADIIIFLFIGLFVICAIETLVRAKTMYFNDNKLTIKNKMGKKKVFDISKHPRIYIKKIKRTYMKGHNYYVIEDGYCICIEQNNEIFSVDIRTIGKQNVALLLDNLLLKEKNEATEEEWKMSANREERIYESIINCSYKKRIAGVKNKDLDTKIYRTSIAFYLLMETLISLIGLLIFTIVIKEWEVVVIIISAIVVISSLTIALLNEKSVKISYPQANVIKVNDYYFDYTKYTIMINATRIRTKNTDNKYIYTMSFSDTEQGEIVSFSKLKLEKIENFINNLEFI